MNPRVVDPPSDPDPELAEQLCRLLENYHLPNKIQEMLKKCESSTLLPRPVDDAVHHGITEELRRAFPYADKAVVAIISKTLRVESVTRCILQRGQINPDALLVWYGRAHKGGGDSEVESLSRTVYGPVILVSRRAIIGFIEARQPEISSLEVNTALSNSSSSSSASTSLTSATRKTHAQCLEFLFTKLKSLTMPGTVQAELSFIMDSCGKLDSDLWEAEVALGQKHLRLEFGLEMERLYRAESPHHLSLMEQAVLSPQVIEVIERSTTAPIRGGCFYILFIDKRRQNEQPTDTELMLQLFQPLFEPLHTYLTEGHPAADSGHERAVNPGDRNVIAAFHHHFTYAPDGHAIPRRAN